MDFLGKEGEKAAEAVQNLSMRIEDLESHINAVDNAVQDLRHESRESDIEVAEENRDRLKDLEQLMVKLTEVQKKNLKDIEAEESREVRLKDKVNALDQRLKRTREEQNMLQEKLDEVEEKLFDVEEELTSGTELNKSKIHSRVTEERFERDMGDLKEEVSKIKTSLNALADELDDDKVKVE